MNLSEQRSLALEILRKINDRVDDEAFIAGGCPRNWESGKLANDVDVYLRCNWSGDKLEELIRSAIGEGYTIEKTKESDMKEYDLCLSIIYLLNLSINGVDFQFIVLDPYKGLQKTVLSSFDLGICRVGVTPYKTVTTPEYLLDVENKTLTFYYSHLNDIQVRRAMDTHIPKVMGYYPDHRLVLEKVVKEIPEDFNPNTSNPLLQSPF